MFQVFMNTQDRKSNWRYGCRVFREYDFFHIEDRRDDIRDWWLRS